MAGCHSQIAYEREAIEVTRVMKENGVNLSKRCNGITSSFVAKTNLFPSYNLIHSEGRLESIVSESVSLSNFNP